jgi:hypothetical protein
MIAPSAMAFLSRAISLSITVTAIALSGNFRGDRLKKSNNALFKTGDHCLYSL